MAGKRKASRAEMEILHYVMDHQPVTVRQVADAMAQRRGLARTTVQTLMERLRDKGLLTRSRIEGLHHYSLRVPRRTLLSDLVRDFIDTALGGSISPFVAYLTQREDLTKEQAAELRRILQSLERQEGGEAEDSNGHSGKERDA